MTSAHTFMVGFQPGGYNMDGLRPYDISAQGLH